ncbi:MAG: metallophosphoesterase family protein [Candidatus Woesearchaeota archaeon]
MLEHKVLYTSDVHGNEKQLRALVDYALDVKPSTVIIAGEIAPKDMPFEESGIYIKAQRYFLSNTLPKLMERLKSQLPQTMIYVSMGNDDARSNIDVLKQFPQLYTELHGNRLKLNSDFDIVGYSYCPITPFAVKDWEKFDLTNIPAQFAEEYAKRKRTNYGLDRAIKSVAPNEWINFEFSLEDELKDSIQLDLRENIYTQNSGKTIYVFHAPPNETALDILSDNQHMGSYAIREFIEKNNPYITLHGHIHETVRMSKGKFKENIGNTISMSAGNHNEDSNVSALLFDAYNPQSVQRVTIPCSSLSKLFSKVKYDSSK